MPNFSNFEAITASRRLNSFGIEEKAIHRTSHRHMPHFDFSLSPFHLSTGKRHLHQTEHLNALPASGRYRGGHPGITQSSKWMDFGASASHGGLSGLGIRYTAPSGYGSGREMVCRTWRAPFQGMAELKSKSFPPSGQSMRGE